MDDSIEIVLMNAYARLSATECPERYNVVRPRKSTVADLKRFLRKNYPTKPDPNKQKLIFNGKLLGNDQILGQVFNQQVYKDVDGDGEETEQLKKYFVQLVIPFASKPPGTPSPALRRSESSPARVRDRTPPARASRTQATEAPASSANLPIATNPSSTAAPSTNRPVVTNPSSTAAPSVNRPVVTNPSSTPAPSANRPVVTNPSSTPAPSANRPAGTTPSPNAAVNPKPTLPKSSPAPSPSPVLATAVAAATTQSAASQINPSVSPLQPQPPPAPQLYHAMSAPAMMGSPSQQMPVIGTTPTNNYIMAQQYYQQQQLLMQQQSHGSPRLSPHMSPQQMMHAMQQSPQQMMHPMQQSPQQMMHVMQQSPQQPTPLQSAGSLPPFQLPGSASPPSDRKNTYQLQQQHSQMQQQLSPQQQLLLFQQQQQQLAQQQLFQQQQQQQLLQQWSLQSSSQPYILNPQYAQQQYQMQMQGSYLRQQQLLAQQLQQQQHIAAGAVSPQPTLQNSASLGAPTVATTPTPATQSAPISTPARPVETPAPEITPEPPIATPDPPPAVDAPEEVPPPVEAVAVADVAVAGPAPEPQRNFFAFVDFALIAKLAIIVIIFNDGTTNRAAILSAFSVLFYFYQVGLFALCFRNRDNGPSAGTRSFLRGGIRPRVGNCCIELFRDLIYLVFSFILCLLPWWRPTLVAVPQPAAPGDAEPQRVVVGHEHQD